MDILALVDRIEEAMDSGRSVPQIGRASCRERV